MKVVVQRVIDASVSVDNKVVGKIDKGYLLLVGFTHTDTFSNCEAMAKKIKNLRIFEDENQKIDERGDSYYIWKCDDFYQEMKHNDNISID